MLRASKYCTLTPLSSVEVLWHVNPAGIRREMKGVTNYRNTQKCKQTRDTPSGFPESSRVEAAVFPYLVFDHLQALCPRGDAALLYARIIVNPDK